MSFIVGEALQNNPAGLLVRPFFSLATVAAQPYPTEADRFWRKVLWASMEYSKTNNTQSGTVNVWQVTPKGQYAKVFERGFETAQLTNSSAALSAAGLHETFVGGSSNYVTHKTALDGLVFPPGFLLDVRVSGGIASFQVRGVILETEDPDWIRSWLQ